jgi:ATP-dependent metalloprotease FtsH
VQTLGFEELDSPFKGSSKCFVKGSAWKGVRGVYRHRVTEIYEIHYLGGVVRTTGDHSVFVRTRDGIKAVAARDLKPGHVLVNLPLKVRGEYAAGRGTPHTVRAHEFAPLAEPLYLAVAEKQEQAEEAYAFALANRDVLTQREIAETIGVCQATVSNWQTDLRRPRALSDRYGANVLPECVPVTCELMRLLGYYTAEGRDNGCVQFVFGAHEADLHADCIALGQKLFGLTPAVDHTEDNSTRITFYSAPLGRFFARHCGAGSRNKHVPEFLWDLPREYFLAYLQGYVRGDGYVSGEGKLIATSVSRQLIRELAWLCAMHGIKVGVRYTFTPGGRVIKNKPLPDEEAWALIIGKNSNPFAPRGPSGQQGKRAVVREIIVKPFDGYVYDLCGCDNEAFFGGEKPVLLHNSRVRDMFKTAKENSPCILFIDEIDAVGRMRGAGVGGGSDEREQTLNQILSEMDGFTPTESVIVMAATNRPDVLDSALLRPGRFDRHITIDRPTWQGRLAILKVHTRNKPLADDVNLEAVARSMIGMTGADLRNLTNEAALLATREGKSKISRIDFERAADRVLMGPKREEVLTAEGKRRTACHEAGHAVVSWLEPEADPPQKVSIIPRGRALGVTFNLPEEERYHLGMDYFKARLVVLMGGRAADRLVYHQPYSGHEDDLKQATRLARYMVTHWGMSERLGPMAFRVGEEHVFLGKEIQEPRDFSEGTAEIIDEEVQRILREADERAYELLEKNRDKLEALIEALLQREELLKEEIDQILGGTKTAITESPNGAPTTPAVFAPEAPPSPPSAGA